MYEYKATVVRVVDGDTVRLKVDLGFFLTYEANFRLINVDTPEIIGEERSLGLAAKTFVEKLIPVGCSVEIKTFKPDKYGRWLVDIILNEQETVSSVLIDYGLGKKI
jgi:micrococcal nuclease